MNTDPKHWDPVPATRFQSSGIGFDVKNLFEIKAGSGLKGACFATVFQIDPDCIQFTDSVSMSQQPS